MKRGVSTLMIVAPALLGALLVACDGDGDNKTPAPTRSPSAVATVGPSPTPSLEEEIGQAYLAYWDAYGKALLELDASLAEGFAVGEELDRIREEIEGLRAQGLALRVQVEHNFVIVEKSSAEATLRDKVLNNSFYVDAKTKEPPTGSGSGDTLEDTFYLKKTNDRWTVVRSTRQR